MTEMPEAPGFPFPFGQSCTVFFFFSFFQQNFVPFQALLGHLFSLSIPFALGKYHRMLMSLSSCPQP